MIKLISIKNFYVIINRLQVKFGKDFIFNIVDISISKMFGKLDINICLFMFELHIGIGKDNFYDNMSAEEYLKLKEQVPNGKK